MKILITCARLTVWRRSLHKLCSPGSVGVLHVKYSKGPCWERHFALLCNHRTPIQVGKSTANYLLYFGLDIHATHFQLTSKCKFQPGLSHNTYTQHTSVSQLHRHTLLFSISLHIFHRAPSSLPNTCTPLKSSERFSNAQMRTHYRVRPHT